MKNYVTIKMIIEDINCMQTELLVGMPSLVAYMSFVENILLKSEISKTRSEEVFIGISRFQYKEMYEKSSENLNFKNGVPERDLGLGSVNISPKGILETEISFDIDSDLITFDIISKLQKTIFGLKFSGGVIKDFSVFVEKEKKLALRKMFPTFIINSDKKDYDNIDSLIAELLVKEENKKDKNIVVSGYGFLSDISNTQNLNYDMVHGEPLYRLITKEALTNKNILEIKGWSWDLTDSKKISIKQKGE